MMTTYQNRRIAQLIDKLIDHKISTSEYVEYQYLCKLLSGEYMPLNEENSPRRSSNNYM